MSLDALTGQHLLFGFSAVFWWLDVSAVSSAPGLSSSFPPQLYVAFLFFFFFLSHSFFNFLLDLVSSL